VKRLFDHLDSPFILSCSKNITFFSPRFSKHFRTIVRGLCSC
jgi:hypothetical protein